MATPVTRLLMDAPEETLRALEALVRRDDVDPQLLRDELLSFFEDAREHRRTAETFAAQLGHDLRNPLNSIAMTSRLIQVMAKDPAIRRHAERLCASSTRMARMLDDLFDLSRAQLGEGIRPVLERGDALVVVKRAIAMLEVAHPSGAIRLDASGDTTGEWDLARLEQVVSSLVANALQHGAENATVDVSVRGTETDVVLEVHNAGAIPASLLPKIFEPFRPGGVTRARHRGLGLGLFIVHQTVIAHAGAIDVRSDEVDGTTFRVQLPRRPARART